MNPGDWVADCMVPDAWMHEPFCLMGDAVVCDGSAVVCFPGRGGEFSRPLFDDDSDFSPQIIAVLCQAKLAETVPTASLKDLGLTEEHYARLAAEPHLHLLIEQKRIIFHVIDPEAGELQAYGVIYKGAQ